jgi:uncharacterized protein
MERQMKAEDFLAQKRIAVAGVSRRGGDDVAANRIYRRLKKTGHDVFAINPNTSTFDDDRCYPSVRAIPDGVDGVVIVTRPETTEQIVHECHDAGIRSVWMHRSLGSDGSSVSPRAVEYCQQHGIDVISNGCPMMFGPGADFGHTCMRWILRLKGEL